MKLLYAIPSYQCNLRCPHCEIHSRPEVYNRDKFISQLNAFEGDGINIFGGEPTLHEDRLFDVVSENIEHGKTKITGISTNLTILNDRLIRWYKELGGLATSWNPQRFGNKAIYEQWLENCHTISAHEIKYILMITLTNDLFDAYSPEQMIWAIHQMETPGLRLVKFEHYVGADATPEYFARADTWLAEVVRLWDVDVNISVMENACEWNFNCDDVYTLLPDGTMVNRCPHLMDPVVPTECLTCQKISECRPCRIQRYCSYPEKTIAAVRERKGVDPNDA